MHSKYVRAFYTCLEISRKNRFDRKFKINDKLIVFIVKEEKHDISIMRGEVVLTETRFKSSYEPYGNGVIGYLKLKSQPKSRMEQYMDLME